MQTTSEFSAESIAWYVGIDISKAWLDVHLRPTGRALQCDNTAEGFTELDRWLRHQGARPTETMLCMEQTGVYGHRLLAAMTDLGWWCAVEKTTITATVGPEHHRKEDAYDAALIAEYAERYLDTLHLQEPAEETIETLRCLYAERSRLVRGRAATKTKQAQADQYVHTPVLLTEMWEDQLTFYDAQIARIEARMQECVDSHEGLVTYYRLLTSIPGVGKVTAWLWLFLFYGQPHLNHKQVASRFGFAPHSNRSGSSTRGKTRSSGHGVSAMRAQMTMVARSVSTHRPKFRDYKQKKKQENKEWPIIRNNLINKMIKIMCAIWNSQTPYDPQHTSRFDREKQAA